ncbi:MAG TPA: type I DNA topoisomerase [Prolixibacteraceae bacterium]|nr:type I DNA topoisomerase [Prolixibacteraceae bacterium]HPR85945.1 type I DNA topoisomerase [Prolixibacteraceae bacterium]
MQENLVIVESPAKAKTIEKFLGKDFFVTSSMGHIRDLEKKDFGIDIQNNFTPKYEITSDKKKLVTELKKLAKDAKTIWLASDEDREGEAISWHLIETLHLDPQKTKRIVFHEITKEAILHAIQNPRPLDLNLVNAQQARRVLDRIVGFEVSPVLWKKVKPSLSAGRVQSVAVRLIVEREREIMNFNTTSSYRVTANFLVPEKDGKVVELKAELNKRFDTREQAFSFLEKCKSAEFQIDDVVKRPSKRSPAPPFTTSTLQQEASRKLGYSVSQTMTVAQKLYESGKITYMRTDSVNLSGLAINTAKQVILSTMGEKYHQVRQYKTKSKGAQEAHEAIRPTYLDQEEISGTAQEKRLYELIWKRTVASQMSDAELEKTTVTIDISNSAEKFIATGEVLIFDGFLKVYIESVDDEDQNGGQKGLLPALTAKQILRWDKIFATERFTQKPPRYTEASLVKKLEEQGIGRPSTYAPTITTIQNRGYVVKEDREGVERGFTEFVLAGQKIAEKQKIEVTGAEKSKLFPTDIGMVVNDFLMRYFDLIMDYNFTAKVEKEFDEIAEGELIWNEMLGNFYKPFHSKVESAINEAERANGVRVLGIDPNTGLELSVKIGRFGPIAQLGEATEEGAKPQFASLRAGQHIETITLDEALELFKLPRTLGDYEGKTVVVAIGRFGPYVRHDGKFISLEKKVDDPYSIELPRAIELIESKREKDLNALLKVFDENPDLKILNGRWGPYISYKKGNYKIPKNTDATKLTLDDCMKLIDGQSTVKKSRKK